MKESYSTWEEFLGELGLNHIYKCTKNNVIPIPLGTPGALKQVCELKKNATTSDSNPG